MNYSNAPVSMLLRGPLLCTPQGWVVLASIAGYGALGGAVFAFDLTLPVAKSPGGILVFCVAWPLITFMYFVKSGMPSFNWSWPKAAWLAFVALAPVAYVIGRPYLALW